MTKKDIKSFFNIVAKKPALVEAGCIHIEIVRTNATGTIVMFSFDNEIAKYLTAFRTLKFNYPFEQDKDTGQVSMASEFDEVMAKHDFKWKAVLETDPVEIEGRRSSCLGLIMVCKSTDVQSHRGSDAFTALIIDLMAVVEKRIKQYADTKLVDFIDIRPEYKFWSCLDDSIWRYQKLYDLMKQENSTIHDLVKLMYQEKIDAQFISISPSG